MAFNIVLLLTLELSTNIVGTYPLTYFPNMQQCEALRPYVLENVEAMVESSDVELISLECVYENRN